MDFIDNSHLTLEFKKLLLDLGISQADVASRLGITRQNLNCLLNKKQLSFDNMQTILNVCGYKLTYDFVKKSDTDL